MRRGSRNSARELAEEMGLKLVSGTRSSDKDGNGS